METLSIVKIGGKIINHKRLLLRFLASFQKIKGHKILVHGGGRAATEFSKRMGVEVTMIDGRRVTDRQTLDIAVMTYAGLINKTIVATLQSIDCNAIGLSGADANLIHAQKREIKDIDFGFVGDIERINGQLLRGFLQSDIVPVLCPITHNNEGQLLNTNADSIAAKVTQEMSKQYQVTLKYCFEYNGVLENLEDPTSILSTVTRQQSNGYISSGVFADGMIPKVENAFEALENGAHEVYICGIKHVHEQNPGTQFTL